MTIPIFDAVVCGLGPSVHGWVPPIGVCIFGVNDVGGQLTLDHLVVVDRRERFSEERRRTIESTRAKNAWLAVPDGWNMACDEVHRLDIEVVDPGRTLVLDGPRVPQYQTSPFAATALAFRLGYRRIGLIGVDLVGHPLESRAAKIDGMFRRLSDEIEAKGGFVVNLSIVSNLRSLPTLQAPPKYLE